uniref:BTB domain-containing protein n=1 Tax=Homalodisca liturata TaxID=320908 RepID=A0A1B6J2R1_9HEMI
MTDNEVCLRWNAFKSNLMNSLESLWNEDEYVDVTLSCGGHQVRSHQVVLSASSPFFSEIFKDTSTTHPTVIIPETQISNLKQLLKFMYTGEIYIEERNLVDFLNLAEDLQVRGLYGRKFESDEKVQVDQNEKETSVTREKRSKRKKSSSHAEHSKLIKTEPSWISDRIKEEFVKVEIMEDEGGLTNAVDCDKDIPMDELPEDLSSTDLPEDLSSVDLPMTSIAFRNELLSDLCAGPPYQSLPFAELLPQPDTLAMWSKGRSLDLLACDLMKILFTTQERITCNVNGKMGKLQFNVDKINLIKEVIHYFSGYSGEIFEEQWKVCVTKIDTSNRGLKRKFLLKGII